MNFTLTTVSENFSRLRLVSETEKWELGLAEMLFGVRVRLAVSGVYGCAVDYCAGDDLQFQIELLDAVRTILIPIPEQTPQSAVERHFPGYTVKPISRDPACWASLKAMRDSVKSALKITEDFRAFK